MRSQHSNQSRVVAKGLPHMTVRWTDSDAASVSDIHNVASASKPERATFCATFD